MYLSSGLWHPVLLSVGTIIFEKHAVSIFMFEVSRARKWFCTQSGLLMRVNTRENMKCPKFIEHLYLQVNKNMSNGWDATVGHIRTDGRTDNRSDYISRSCSFVRTGTTFRCVALLSSLLQLHNWHAAVKAASKVFANMLVYVKKCGEILSTPDLSSQWRVTVYLLTAVARIYFVSYHVC